MIVGQILELFANECFALDRGRKFVCKLAIVVGNAFFLLQAL